MQYVIRSKKNINIRHCKRINKWIDYGDQKQHSNPNKKQNNHLNKNYCCPMLLDVGLFNWKWKLMMVILLRISSFSYCRSIQYLISFIRRKLSSFMRRKGIRDINYIRRKFKIFYPSPPSMRY